MRCGWGPYFRRTFEVQAGNSPLQGQSKPPAKLVVLIQRCLKCDFKRACVKTAKTLLNFFEKVLDGF